MLTPLIQNAGVQEGMLWGKIPEFKGNIAATTSIVSRMNGDTIDLTFFQCGMAISVMESLPFVMGTCIHIMSCSSEQVPCWNGLMVASRYWNECHRKF